MKNSLDDRIEDYLNGVLSDEDTKRFEEDLLKEDVAAEFREVLFMKELLRDIPPDEVPPGLVDKIEKSLMRSLVREKRQAVEGSEYRGRSRFGKIADAFKQGLSWPRYALPGISGGTGVIKDSFSGMNTVSYSLGPLREPARKGINSIRSPKRPLWKIVLSKLW